MPSQWDHKADKDLLLTIIEDGNLTHINWQSISAKLETKNYTFSHEACRQHYQKIRRESRNNTTPISTPTKPTPASKQPRTPHAAAASSSAASKSLNASVSTPSNGDDDEDFATPSAKRKRVAKKKLEEPAVDLGGFVGQTAAQFKVEEFGGGEGGEGYVVDLVDDG